MIETPTVFVLGAGASVPFGFPTGYGLAQEVYNRAKPENDIYQNISQFRLTDTINHFANEFHASGFNSVDAFLEQRTDLMAVGKLCIAHCLISKEQLVHLMAYADENWLRALYNRMATSFDQLHRNQVAFVTFNYDRTVEQFFFSAISNSYQDMAPDNVRAFMEQHLPIIHLHGRLGYLPWQGRNSEDTRDYYHEVTREGLVTASKHIKIIHEDITDGRDADFARAKDMLHKAEKIVFMGFGYNERNIARLGVRDLPSGKGLGSAMGMGTVAVQAAQRATNKRIKFFPFSCVQMLSEVLTWP